VGAGAAVTTIAHQIQLAVAPVFLLAGIGSILNVLAGRLARVVERARQLERDFVAFDDETRAAARAELEILDLRMSVVNFALSAYDDWRRLAWAGALLIAAAVLGVTVLARTLAKEQRRS